MDTQKLKSLRDAGVAVLMGARPYPTGTDSGPERSVVETWRIKQLAEELKRLNAVIENGVDPEAAAGAMQTQAGGLLDQESYRDLYFLPLAEACAKAWGLPAAPPPRTENEP